MRAKWARRRMQRRMVENFRAKYGPGRSFLSEFAISYPHHWAARMRAIPKQFWTGVQRT